MSSYKSAKRQDRFTADHAMDITMSRHESFEKTMAIIRNMIDEQIRDAAKTGRQSAFIELPKVVFGRESYDLVEMGRAIVDQLFEDKFDVSGTYTRFTVRWGEKKKTNLMVTRPGTQQAPQPTVYGARKTIINVPMPKKR